MNYYKKAKGAARLAILSGLAAIAMNSCHNSRRTFTVNSYPGYENPFRGGWKGPYFIYGYPTEKSKNKGLLNIRIRRNGFVSGEIFYNGMKGELEGVVNERGEFISNVDFDCGMFTVSSDFSGRVGCKSFYARYYSENLIMGEFIMSINGSSYKGDLALLPADVAEPQEYYLEKILTSASTSSALQ